MQMKYILKYINENKFRNIFRNMQELKHVNYTLEIYFKIHLTGSLYITFH